MKVVGLPLAVAVQLQQSNLKLEGALWTAKCSGSGFLSAYSGQALHPLYLSLLKGGDGGRGR